MSDDVVAFIEARLAEDERTARATTPGPWADAAPGSVYVEQAGLDNAHLIAEFPTCEEHDDHREEDARHIATHDPSRVLRGVVAHRRLLADILAQQHFLNDWNWYGCRAFTSSPDSDLPDLPTGRPCSCGRDADVERRLRLLAAIWSDSPGFRSEWLIEERTDG